MESDVAVRKTCQVCFFIRFAICVSPSIARQLHNDFEQAVASVAGRHCVDATPSRASAKRIREDGSRYGKRRGRRFYCCARVSTPRNGSITATCALHGGSLEYNGIQVVESERKEVFYAMFLQ
jgi:hypothetical protein